MQKVRRYRDDYRSLDAGTGGSQRGSTIDERCAGGTDVVDERQRLAFETLAAGEAPASSEPLRARPPALRIMGDVPKHIAERSAGLLRSGTRDLDDTIYTTYASALTRCRNRNDDGGGSEVRGERASKRKRDVPPAVLHRKDHASQRPLIGPEPLHK